MADGKYLLPAWVIILILVVVWLAGFLGILGVYERGWEGP